MADDATTWNPPPRKDGKPWPDISALAAMPEYECDMYIKLMGNDAPPASLLETERARDFLENFARISEKISKLRVYFIQAASGPIKIGYAADPSKRLYSMQAGSFEKLTLLCTTPGDRHLEAKYHYRFREHWLRGEWFAPHSDLIAEIDRLNAQVQP